MAWFFKRGTRRRIPLERARQVLPRPVPSPTPLAKRAVRYLITALFIAGGLAALNFPRREPRLRVGELAVRDYRARVAFRLPDADATHRDRDAAQTKCPRIFRENRDHLERLPLEMERFLREIAEARRPADFAHAARVKWGITRDKLLALRQGLDRRWIQSAVEALGPALKRAADFGIMDSSERQAELASERHEIVVQLDRPDGIQEMRRSVALALEHPAGVRELLEEELKDLFRDRQAVFREAFLDAVAHAATPTLKRDEVATSRAMAAAAASVETRYRSIPKGSVLLAAGERVTPEVLAELEAESAAFAREGLQSSPNGRQWRLLGRELLAFLGVSAIFLIGFSILMHSVRAASHEILSSNTRLAWYYGICLLVLGFVWLLEHLQISLQWTPMVLAAMVCAIMIGQAAAFGTAVLLSVLVGAMTEAGIALTVPLLAGASIGIICLRRLRRRAHVFEAGIAAGGGQFAAVWAIWASRGASGTGALPVVESVSALGGGALAGAVLSVTLPYIEALFDVATDLRLLEWTDQNQPLLRKLALEAPGTYHHSAVVSNMSEAAAGEIGANALLARAAGYLHDVGKISRPAYFVENNTSGNPGPHEHLSPMLSALILTAHTKDGVELAAQYGVPKPIRRIIGEHHGTTIVEYFYNKALSAAKDPAHAPDPEGFRYRGNKPRSPEAAIVMLADSAESAARTLDGASPAKIERLVHDIVEKRLKDGQLDESRMNITDIRAVEKSLVRSLMGILHPRIRYATS